MERPPRLPIVYLEEPEGMEGEYTNMEVDSPVIPSNNDLNNYEEIEESNNFDSDLEHALTITYI